jgi:photosystem II stability/assembly factor-like uncharacterized protein
MHLAKRFFWMLAFVSITGSCYAQSGWVLQTNPLGIDTLLGKIQFVSSTEGWISASNGRLLHTTNAGANWTVVTPFPSDTVSSMSDPALTMWWVNQTHGWKMNWLGSSMGNAHGAVIHKTTDGGTTWQKKVLSTVVGDIGISIQFVDENNGWALIVNRSSGQTKSLHSTDGGNNWDLIETGGLSYFFDANIGWMTTRASLTEDVPPYYICHTTNGGVDWSVQYTDNTAGSIGKIQFTDLSNGWAVGDSAKILKTTDGGSNWTPITNTGNNSNHKNLFFLNANVGWIASREYSNQGGGLILHTTDGGVSWSIQNSPVPYIYSIYFVDANNGWFTAEDCIYHTTNGGTGVEDGDNSIPSGYSLSQNYPNPFNPSTNISFNLLSKSFVSLKIFDLLGREVTTIVYEQLSAGDHSRQWNAANMPSGVYFYRLSVVPSARRDLVPTEGRNGQAGSFTETKKLVLLK